MDWTCLNCGESNEGSVLDCPACAHPRYADLESFTGLGVRPHFAASRSFFLFVIWATLTLAGLVLLAVPSTRQSFGTWFLLMEISFAAWATWSSLASAFWDHWFRTVDVVIPPMVEARQIFEVGINLVPYADVPSASIRAEFHDRHFGKDWQGRVDRRSDCLERFEVARGQPLRGRKLNSFAVNFHAPFPLTEHENALVELQAGFVGLLGLVLPGASHAAKNIREHGGFHVRVRVRVGWLSRVFEKRVVVFYAGERVVVG